MTRSALESVAVGLAVWVVFTTLASSEPGSVNDAANLWTVERLFHHGTFELPPPEADWRLGRLYWDDVMKVGDAFYSVRPPVLAFMSVAPYAMAEMLAAVVGSYDRVFRIWLLVVTGLAIVSLLVASRRSTTSWRRLGFVASGLLGGGVGLVVLMLPPREAAYPLLVSWSSGGLAAMAVALVVREGRAVGLPADGRLLVVAGLGLSSMLTVYVTVVNHHTTAGALLTLAACGLLRWRREGTVSRGAALLVGLGLGLAATIDPAGGGVFLLCLAPLVWRRQRGVFVVAGIALAGALHVVLNYQITGGIVPGLLRPELFDFPQSRQTPELLSGLGKWDTVGDRVRYAARMMGGARGVLVYSPLVVPALVGVVRLGRSNPYHRECLALAGASVLLGLYLIEFTGNISGICYGIRWLVMPLSVWWLLLVVGWRSFDRVERACVIGLAWYSAYVAWWGVGQGAWQAYPVPVPSLAVRLLLLVFLAGLAIRMVLVTRGAGRRLDRPPLQSANRGADSPNTQ